MIITHQGSGRFKIKTRDASIALLESGVDIDGYKITGPGEYERKNIFVGAPFELKIFKILVEDVMILYPDKTEKISEKQLEQLDGVDLLFLPCGEEESMNLKDALELAAKLEPSVIIPMYFGDLSALKKEGLEGETAKNAKISKSALPAEGNITMFLEKT